MVLAAAFRGQRSQLHRQEREAGRQGPPVVAGASAKLPVVGAVVPRQAVAVVVPPRQAVAVSDLRQAVAQLPVAKVGQGVAPGPAVAVVACPPQAEPALVVVWRCHSCQLPKRTAFRSPHPSPVMAGHVRSCPRNRR